jgi:hypothetical protein
MSFLTEETRTGQVYSGGWIAAEGGDMPVREPATGRELGRIGGLELARRIPTGVVHINEQTVDEPNVPFGGLLYSGTGARFGGTANLDAFTETRWVTVRGDIAPYLF